MGFSHQVREFVPIPEFDGIEKHSGKQTGPSSNRDASPTTTGRMTAHSPKPKAHKINNILLIHKSTCALDMRMLDIPSTSSSDEVEQLGSGR